MSTKDFEQYTRQDEPVETRIKVQNEPINSLGLQESAVVKAIEANDTVALDREGARKTGRWVLKMGE